EINQHLYVLGPLSEFVPFILSPPLCRQWFGGWKFLVDNFQQRFLWCRMTRKIRPYQFTEPRPVVLAIRCSMDTGKPATSLDIPLKSLLLSIVQHVTCSA